MNKTLLNQEITESLIKTVVLAIMLVACWYKLWFASVIPMGVSMTRLHDGALFYNLALSLFHGQWLGEYNQYTLIKGAGLPAFLAACAKIGISPQLVTHLLYALGCLTFYKVLRLLGANRAIALFGFVLLLFNPVTLSRMWLGLARQTLYMPLVVFFLSSLIAIIFYVVKREHFRKLLPWSLLCSVSLAAALNTREEGIWMITTLTPLIIVMSAYSYFHKRFDYLICFFIICFFPFITHHYIASMNYEKYGVKITNEMKEKNYSLAWDAVLSLNTILPSYYNSDTKVINEEIHMTLETRDKMLKISPLTKQVIEQVLDKKTGLYRGFKDKVNGTYGLWLLRDAMDYAGYYQTPKLAMETYGKLADDIEAYCQEEKGNCKPVVISKVHWKEGHWQKIFPTIQYVINFASMFPDVFLLKKKELQYLDGSLEFKQAGAKFFSSEPHYAEEHNPISPNTNYVASVLNYHDIKKWRRLEKNFDRYNTYFPYLLFSCLFLLIIILFRSWRKADKVFILATLSVAFFSICAINIAIALTAYTAVARPTSPATIMVIMFIPIIISYALQEIKPKPLK